MNKRYLFPLLALCGLLAGSLSSCGDADVEPAVYAPKQIQRLLFENSTKTWKQRTEYYLEDSCKTGYLLRFQKSPSGRVDSAFSAFYFPDPAVCDADQEGRIDRVKIVISPIFKTTDSLLFISPQKDTTIKTIGLLTSQRLLLNVAGGNGRIERVEEYRAVE